MPQQSPWGKAGELIDVARVARGLHSSSVPITHRERCVVPVLENAGKCATDEGAYVNFVGIAALFMQCNRWPDA